LTLAVASQEVIVTIRESSGQRSAMRQAYHYLELARRHPAEEAFWLCRAAYFGRLSWHWPEPKR
jgi:hypothetical protein